MRFALLTLGALTAAAPLTAQSDVTAGRAVIIGVQARGYSIDNGPSSQQFAFPLAVVVPVNERFTFDIGTYYASTSTTPSGGSKVSLNGITDTQVRGSYTFGRDALVTTLMVNIPTGSTPTITESSATGAAAANFLSFPVNNYRTGFAVTGGVAAATQAGSWNLGIAGSVRLNSQYAPFSDDNTRYSPGTEGRVRLAAERLLGNSRLVLGFTWSTFGNDEFKNLGGGSGQYAPGDRFIGEASMSFLVGKGTVTGYLWDYYRTSASGSGITSNKENILSVGGGGSWPIGTNMRLEPIFEARFWSPQSGSGRLVSAGTGLQIPLGSRFTFAPSGRFDVGSTKFTDGSDHSLTGWGFSALLRYQI